MLHQKNNIVPKNGIKQNKNTVTIFTINIFGFIEHVLEEDENCNMGILQQWSIKTSEVENQSHAKEHI